MLAFDVIKHGKVLVLLVCLSAFCHSSVGYRMWENQLLCLNYKTAAKEEQRRKDVSFLCFFVIPFVGGMAFLRLL